MTTESIRTHHANNANLALKSVLRVPRKIDAQQPLPQQLPQQQPGWREDRMVAFSLSTRTPASSQTVRLPALAPRSAAPRSVAE